MSKEIYLTEEGLKTLTEELNHLKLVKRPEVIIALKEARALGDLSENAEYDAANAEQAIVEGRIKELETIIERATIVKSEANGHVAFGNKVTIEYVDDKEQEDYYIVGVSEVDPFANKISNESPMAKAILDKKVGDIVTVKSENGEYQVKIIAIA
jgi:transcription elongation factor GreA